MIERFTQVTGHLICQVIYNAVFGSSQISSVFLCLTQVKVSDYKNVNIKYKKNQMLRGKHGSLNIKCDKSVIS